MIWIVIAACATWWEVYGEDSSHGEEEEGDENLSEMHGLYVDPYVVWKKREIDVTCGRRGRRRMCKDFCYVDLHAAR